MQGVRKSALLLRSRNGLSSLLGPNPAKKCLAHVGFSSSTLVTGKAAISRPTIGIPMPSKSGFLRHFTAGAAHIAQLDSRQANGLLVFHGRWNCRQSSTAGFRSSCQLLQRNSTNSSSRFSARSFASRMSRRAEQKQSETKKDVSTVEDPFDAPTYNIPEKPVTFTEGASYTLVILVGLGLAAAAGYAVFKELIFEPKEYKIFNMALKRIQDDGQVRVRIGSPITGYGQESRNRAARQRIPNKIYTDEDGVEHVLVSFHIRGPHGAGKVSAEMFRDKVDKQWKYTYLIVQITHPSQSQLILESYIPAAAPVPA
ncbi:unnamed protein product [Linum tenue]|uniref:Mitochondrial import inner membrane translocase subunit Tim21 n=1 Tax=Linum tenue TaxID=586396 RepID=A0AAV0MJG3_9ROSI|nr:unnamed protein product [Linum tenue]